MLTAASVWLLVLCENGGRLADGTAGRTLARDVAADWREVVRIPPLFESRATGFHEWDAGIMTHDGEV